MHSLAEDSILGAVLFNEGWCFWIWEGALSPSFRQIQVSGLVSSRGGLIPLQPPKGDIEGPCAWLLEMFGGLYGYPDTACPIDKLRASEFPRLNGMPDSISRNSIDAWCRSLFDV